MSAAASRIPEQIVIDILKNAISICKYEHKAKYTRVLDDMIRTLYFREYRRKEEAMLDYLNIYYSWLENR